ncbi:MAG: ArsR/SmtB family transcription factor [Dehalococcoidia bacterium]
MTCDSATARESLDGVFKALADPGRRLLLDRLFERDGQTLLELSAYLEMTRFGVMKHLHVLEKAGLMTTRKIGREKYHYLNPVPIRRIHDRWISKYAEPFAGSLSRLKNQLEEGEEHANVEPSEARLRSLHPHDAGEALGGDHKP